VGCLLGRRLRRRTLGRLLGLDSLWFFDCHVLDRRFGGFGFSDGHGYNTKLEERRRRVYNCAERVYLSRFLKSENKFACEHASLEEIWLYQAYVRWNSYVESYRTKFIRSFPTSSETQFVVEMSLVQGRVTKCFGVFIDGCYEYRYE
jgi:hypothetical protein